MARHSPGWPPWLQIVTVFCIFTVITAILYPPPGVRDRIRRRVSCQSSMKQLGLAFIQYTQDADEKYPPGVNAAGNGWAGQIYPFIKSTDVYHCPDDPEGGRFISYAENRNIAGKKLKELSAPDATVELYEATTLDCDPSHSEAISMTGLNPPQDSTRHDNHTFALNFLLVNGHVKWLKPEQVSGGAGAVRLKTPLQGAFVETFAVK